MALGAPRYVAAADLNQDGKADLVVTGENTTFNVSVLIGNGDGTFQAPIGYGNVCCSSAAQLAVADFNGDGFADVALAFPNAMGEPNGVDYSGYVVILPGAGDGTLKDPVQLNVGVSVGPYQLAAGDFNGDGKPDIATAVYFSTNTPPGGGTVVLFGNGDGTFQPPVSLAGQGTTVGDFNGDGIDDLAVWNSGPIRVYPGSASGTFGSPIDSAPAWQLMATGDFNADGIADLVSVNNNSSTECSARQREWQFSASDRFPCKRGFDIPAGGLLRPGRNNGRGFRVFRRWPPVERDSRQDARGNQQHDSYIFPEPVLFRARRDAHGDGLALNGDRDRRLL